MIRRNSRIPPQPLSKICRILGIGQLSSIGIHNCSQLWTIVDNCPQLLSTLIHNCHNYPQLLSTFVHNCIVNKVVGSQPNIQSAQGLKGWEKANKNGYDLWKTVQRWPNCDLFRTPLSAWR